MNKNMQTLLSIITINYNDALGLEKTIQSVISQAYQAVDYLVVDGGSTDGSKDVIDKWTTHIDYQISESDTGIYNAMNKGIKAAKGDYLLFLNSGDLLNGPMALHDFIHHPDFGGDIIYGDYQFEKGGKVYPDYLTPLFFVRSSLPHQSTFFKRDVFEKMGMYEEQYKIISDRAFYIKCFLSNQFVFKHVNYPLSIFDLSGVSNNTSHKEKQALENEIMFQEKYGIFYEDYKKMLVLQSHLNQAKQETLSGILKRVVNKIKKTCHIR
jgi:glycosyltransferase involved in cell wall biosynthesis